MLSEQKCLWRSLIVVSSGKDIVYTYMVMMCILVYAQSDVTCLSAECTWDVGYQYIKTNVLSMSETQFCFCVLRWYEPNAIICTANVMKSVKRNWQFILYFSLQCSGSKNIHFHCLCSHVPHYNHHSGDYTEIEHCASSLVNLRTNKTHKWTRKKD